MEKGFFDLNISKPPKGSLSLVGVGPGDPSLLTLAAVKAIQDATFIAYPVSKEGEDSIAAKIASQWITKDKALQPLVFPMVLETDPRRIAWTKATKKLLLLAAKGHQVAFLCEGDVSLFASGCYVLLAIKANYPEYPLKIIPGINSFSAAAAIGNYPLALQNEQLLVMPTPNDSKTLEGLLDDSLENHRILALLKLGDRWTWVRPLLEKKNLLNKSLFAQKVGFIDQNVIQASKVSSDSKPYFSLLLIRQTSPKVLPADF